MSNVPAEASQTKDRVPGGRRRRLLVLIGGIVLAAAAVTAGYLIWFRPTPHVPPEPPSVDLAGADGAVVPAVAAARNQVVESPRSAAKWGQLGMLLLAHDYRAEAKLCFGEAEILDPRDPAWPYLHAQTLLHSSDTPAAVQLLEKAVGLGGKEPAPRLLLGELLVWDGRLDEAEAHFQHVLKRQPKQPRALLGLARVAHARRQWETCKEYLIQSETSAPDVRATHALKAEVYHRLDDPRGAQDALRRLAALPDGFPWPDAYLEAVQQLQVGLKPRVNRATVLLQQGRAAEAVEWMRATVQSYPQAHRAHWVLGRCLSQRGDHAEAETVLREAVRLMPESAGSQYDLGVALQQQSKLAAAAECYAKATQLMPQLAHAHLNRGVCLEGLNKPADAIESYNAAIRYQPELAPAHRKLGELLAKTGKAADALPHLENAVRLAPGDADTQQLLDDVRKRTARRDPS